MQKKNKFSKVLLRAFRKVFHSRSLIIISGRKVDHVPVSGPMQALVLIGFLGFFSGASYITGSYITARSVIKEKENKIVSSGREKNRISEEMELLKRDLVRLNQNGNELNSYSKFIIGQHASLIENGTQTFTSPDANNGLFGQDTSKLLDRISFLEGRMNEVRGENDRLVTAIRARTDKKITYLEDIISMTGLDTESLERSAEEEAKENSVNKAASATVRKKSDEANRKEDERSDNQGGPYIPYDATNLTTAQQDILANVDRLILINDIVSKLPLAQPLEDFQQMSPFGKRVDPFNRKWSMHPGLDLAGPSGSKVMATNAGVVISAGRKPAYGNMVDIEHKFGIVTRYAHLSRITVKEGDAITQGQVIGIQGSTGRSTGEHLHYEVRIEDHPVNPINFLHAGEYVSEN